MDNERAASVPGPDAFLDEAALGRVPLHDDVERLFRDLNSRLPTCRERLGDKTYELIRDNVQILRACFYRQSLTAEAVEVIYQHLNTLARMLSFRAN